MYEFSANSPVNFADPTGLDPTLWGSDCHKYWAAPIDCDFPECGSNDSDEDPNTTFTVIKKRCQERQQQIRQASQIGFGKELFISGMFAIFPFGFARFLGPGRYFIATEATTMKPLSAITSWLGPGITRIVSKFGSTEGYCSTFGNLRRQVRFDLKTPQNRI